MSTHGIQPEGHEHVYCPRCDRHGRHTDRQVRWTTGQIVYAAHAMIEGDGVPCPNTRQPVLPEHRHDRIDVP